MFLVWNQAQCTQCGYIQVLLQSKRGASYRTSLENFLTAMLVRLKLGLHFMWLFIPIACAKQRSSASLRGLKLKWAHKLWEK